MPPFFYKRLRDSPWRIAPGASCWHVSRWCTKFRNRTSYHIVCEGPHESGYPSFPSCWISSLAWQCRRSSEQGSRRDSTLLVMGSHCATWLSQDVLSVRSRWSYNQHWLSVPIKPSNWIFFRRISELPCTTSTCASRLKTWTRSYTSWDHWKMCLLTLSRHFVIASPKSSSYGRRSREMQHSKLLMRTLLSSWCYSWSLPDWSFGKQRHTWKRRE